MLCMESSSSLGSIELGPREAEEKAEMGYLTMADIKGGNFGDEYIQSLCSFDRLELALRVMIQKDEQEKQMSSEIKKIRFFVGSSLSNSNSLDSLLPGFFQVLQKFPKKPRSTHHIGLKSTTKANPEAVAIHGDQGHTTSLKRKHNHGDSDDKVSSAPKKKRTAKKGTDLCPSFDLPEGHNNLIKEKLNGIDLKLILQKELSFSDVNPHLNRLSLTQIKVRPTDFLMPNEIEILDQGVSKTDPNQGCLLRIPFIDTRLKLEIEKGLTLVGWKLTNSEKRTYVLKTTWRDVVKENNLIVGDVIQVWSFRANGNHLHLAMVVVKRAERPGNETSISFNGDECGSSSGCTTASASNEVGRNTEDSLMREVQR